jgi:hypothetical protein
MALGTKTFSNAITFTRASNATYFDSTGILKQASSNVSRIDYNPDTLALRGMLVEEQRTNLFLYSESVDIAHGSWSKGVNTTRTGTEYVLGKPATIYRGDGSGAYEYVRQTISVTSGTTYVVSVYARLVSGTKPTSGHLITIETTPGSSSPRTSLSYSSISLSSTVARYSVAFTATGTGTTSIYLVADQNNTAEISLMGAQVEVGAFATSYIPSSVTFSGRTSDGTYFDSTGTLATASSGVARTTYNPANLSADPFLLLEESRTNSIRNNTMVGAVAGTPGTLPTNWVVTGAGDGVAIQVVGTGTENGITYIDIRYFGTATANSFKIVRFEADNNIAAVSGQSWTASTYMRIAAGSSANIASQEHVVVGFTAVGGLSESTNTPPSLTSTMTRFTTSRVLNNATTAFVTSYYALTFNNGAAIDITLRIGLPQLELGAYATSVITTSSAAVTRSADTSSSASATRSTDIALASAINPWFKPTEGTLYAECIVDNSSLSSDYRYPGLASLDNNTVSFCIHLFLRINSSLSLKNFASEIINNGSYELSQVTGTVTDGTVCKLAVAYKENDSNFAFQGTLGTLDTNVALPNNISQLRIGANRGTAPLSGWIRRIIYYPTRLTDAQLQALTA